MLKNTIKNKHTYIYIYIYIGYIYIYIVSARFYSHYPHIKPQFTLIDYSVLLSYLSPQLFFKIKPLVCLSYVLLNYSESSLCTFLLIHDPKINNIGYI